MKKKDLGFYGVIIAFIVLFLASAIIFKVYNIEILPSQFYGALIGVFITAIVTAFLLRGQTEGDEKREKSVKIFEKKQEVYHHFLEELIKVIQDGEITTIGIKQEDGTIDRSLNKIKDLLSQLAYIQMHTSFDNTTKILEEISKLIQAINEFESDKQKGLTFFYKFSNPLFEIVAILKADLYEEESKPIPEKEIKSILENFGLYREVNDLNKSNIQLSFWNELIRQLKGKGNEFKDLPSDLTKDVEIFYDNNTSNKYRSNEIALIVEKDIFLSVVIEKDDFFYGFKRKQTGVEDAKLGQRIQNTSSSFKANKYWHGWKRPDNYKFDFWSFQSPVFEELKNPRKRENVIRELADEIDRYVKMFRQTGNKDSNTIVSM